MLRSLMLFFKMSLLSLTVTACATHLPTVTHPLKCSVMNIGAPGPEDIALDPSKPSRLFISSLDRRQAKSVGDIYALDIINHRLMKMQRVNEPEDFVFRPHGLDTIRLKDGKEYLYVVAHGPGTTNIKWHNIVQYEIVGNQLRYVRSLSGAYLISPNDVAVDQEGTIVVSNDGTQHFLSTLFYIKRGNVVRHNDQNPDQEWQTLVKHLIYANGVLMHDKIAYLADSRQNQIAQYDIAADGTWQNPRVLATIPNPDNLSLSGDWLYTAGHLKATALVRHFLDKRGRYHSPSALYRTHIHTGETQVLFASDGTDISALSGAQIIGDVLIASAIFDAKLLVCDSPK